MIRTALLLTATALTIGATAPARAQVTGGGTANFVPLWVTPTELGNSNIYSSSKQTGIGTTRPIAKLDVRSANTFIPALYVSGASGPGGSDQNGSDGADAQGGTADPDSGFSRGGSGVAGIGGGSSQLFSSAGPGGYFVGGSDNGTGSSGDGLFATCAVHCYAGEFKGDVNITGTLTAATKNFRIDDPLDPANRYLQHAAVESSEMKNIYDGSIILDAHGEATVELPAWFEAENGMFRYQLTAIGAPSPGLYISRKIGNNHFSIAGGAPGVEVSWQVTGARQDPFARANPLVVEPMKEARERGTYVHPELYAADTSRSVVFARNPGSQSKAEPGNTATAPKPPEAALAASH